MILFINEMTDDLYVFAQLQGLNNVTEDYCNKLVWGRLSGTNAFDIEFPVFLPNSDNTIPNPERIVAINATIAKSENRVVFAGTNLPTVSPKGSPCNQ